MIVSFERRRYGRQSFCWAFVTATDGSRLDLGDPWPGVNWPKKHLDAAVEAAVARHNARIPDVSEYTLDGTIDRFIDNPNDDTFQTLAEVV